MTWIALTFISLVFRSVYGLMTKVLSNRVKASAYTQAFFLTTSGAIISLLLAPFIGGLSFNFDNTTLLTILLVAVSQGLGNVLYFAALRNLTSGTAQIAFSSVLIFNTLLGVGFVSLSLSPLNTLGLILLMIAILSVTTGKVELHKNGVILMTIAAFLFAVFQISSGVISKEVSPIAYLLVAYIGASLVVLCLKFQIIAKDLGRKTILQDAKISFATASLSVGNFLFAYYAYRDAPEPAKVAMLLTAQVVLTVILGYFFLKEKAHVLRKIAAAILVVIAAILIKN